MKLNIQVNSKLKKTPLKRKNVNYLDFEIIELVFESFLKKNKHLKGVKEVSFNLTICGKAKIQSLNRKYRDKNKITDVLSFGVHENLRPDLGPFLKNLPILELGDIFICKDVALIQAREFNISYEMEVIHQLVHGFLHLHGFDHEISLKEELIMEKEEKKLVNKIYKKLGL